MEERKNLDYVFKFMFEMGKFARMFTLDTKICIIINVRCGRRQIISLVSGFHCLINGVHILHPAPTRVRQ